MLLKQVKDLNNAVVNNAYANMQTNNTGVVNYGSKEMPEMPKAFSETDHLQQALHASA